MAGLCRQLQALLTPLEEGEFGSQGTAHYLWMPWSQQLTQLLLSPVLRSGLILESMP